MLKFFIHRITTSLNDEFLFGFISTLYCLLGSTKFSVDTKKQNLLIIRQVFFLDFKIT